MNLSDLNNTHCPARYLADAKEVSPGNYLTLCPFHSDSTPSMRIRKYGQRWNARCFSCNWHGSTVDVVMGICGVSVRDAAHLIETGMVTTFVAAPSPKTYTGNHVAVQPVPIKRCGIVWNWLTETRGLSPGVAERCFQVGESSVAFIYPSGWYKVRSVVDKKRQYVTGSYQAELFKVPGEGLERAVLCEGECCSMAVASVCPVTCYSVPSGACSKITDNMLAELDRYKRIVVVSDADVPGRALAARWKIALGDRCQVVEIGRWKDSNDALMGGDGKLLRDIVMGA